MKSNLFIKVVMVLALGIFIIGCEKEEIDPKFSLNNPGQISEEDYKIYSLVIDARYTSAKIVVEQSSMPGSGISFDDNNYLFLKIEHPKLDTTLVQNYNELNQTSIQFGEYFTSETKQIELISSEELEYIFNGPDINKDWDEFYEKYENSNGIIQFSRIAFNTDRTQAVFEISHSYASLGGEGSIVYLIKGNDGWVLAEVIPTWVS